MNSSTGQQGILKQKIYFFINLNDSFVLSGIGIAARQQRYDYVTVCFEKYSLERLGLLTGKVGTRGDSRPLLSIQRDP